MRWTSVSFLTAALAMLTLSGFVVAGEEECFKGKAVAAQKSIDTLLTKWDAASEKLAKACPDETAKTAAKVAKTAEACPIGSRLGETLAFVQDAVAISVAAEKAFAESCPAKKGEGGCAKLAEVAKTRSGLLASLNALTTRTNVAMSGACSSKSDCGAKAAVAKGDFCAKKAEGLVAAVRGEECNKAGAKLLIKAIDGLECSKKAEALAASIKKEECAKSAAKLIVAAATESAPAGCAEKCGDACKSACGAKVAKGACVKSLLARAGELKASWDKAPAEYAALDEATRNAIRAQVESFPEHIALIPQSVMAIQEGVDSLVRLNSAMQDAVEKNPEILKGVPEELKQRFEANAKLMDETREILARVRSAMEGAMAKKS